MTPKPDSSLKWRFNELTLAYLSIFLVAIGLLVSMASHFWLDETHSYWATNAGFGQIYPRCLSSPLSIAYATLFYAIRELGGRQEWMLRIPSLAAFALSVWFLFRFTRRMFDSRVAWFAIVIFVQIGNVNYAAVDARPYALGLLFVIVSTDLLVRLLESPSRRLAVFYGMTAALVLHFHLLLGVILVVQVLYFCYSFAHGRRIALSYVAIAVLALAAVAAPIVVQALWLLNHAEKHMIPVHPSLGDLVFTLFPKRLTAALLAGVCVALVLQRTLAWKWPARNRAYVVLALIWMFTPAILYFVIARTSPMLIFLPRYLLTCGPGLAICFGLVAASLQPRLAGYLTLTLLLVNAALPFFFPAQLRHTYNRGDWGAALAFAQKETAVDHAPVFIRSQYIESDRGEWRGRPLDETLDFSPLVYYPVVARWIPVQNTFTEEQVSDLNKLFEADLGGTPRFLFAAFSGPASYEPYLKYFQAKVGPGHMRQIADFDYIAVFEFVR